MDIAAKANLHSTTLLLYLVPSVNNFGDAVQEFPMTRHTESGILTVVVLMFGTKSMSFAQPISPMIEIV